MKNVSPAIISKLKFTLGGKEKFSGYLGYIGRENAVDRKKNIQNFDSFFSDLDNHILDIDKKFSGYLGYSGRTNAVDKNININNKKRRKQSKALHSSYFGAEHDSLTKNQLEELKKSFDLAQKNDSLLWEDVFSFNNTWLEEQELFNSKTKELDEKKIKEAIRKSMNYTVEKLNMKDSALWSANIHYDTDNIHVHVAMCEPIPTRKRGYISEKIKNNMKSKVINHLLDFDEEYREINKILRTDLVKSIQDNDISKDINIKILLNEVIKNLPSDKRHWHYNYNTMSDARVHLDRLADYYIKNYKSKEYKELIDKLNKQEERIKSIYGETGNLYKDYKKNKIDELYTRMGNTFLSEIKDVLKEEKENYYKKDTEKNIGSKTVITRNNVRKISKALGDELDNIKNQEKFKELEQKIEYQM